MNRFLDTEDMRFLRKHFSPRIAELKKNEVALRSGQEADSSVLLLDGLIYLCAENEQFSRSILRFYRPGEFFSASTLLPAEQGVSYFLAKSDSRIVFFNREELVHFCSASPQWWKKFGGLWGHELSGYCFLLHQRSIRARLTEFFREEMNIQHGSTIRLPIPYTDLADYLSVDRTAMMKELRKMKDEGLISGKNRILTIH